MLHKLTFIISLTIVQSLHIAVAQTENFQYQRMKMVEKQIEARGISNQLVIKAMKKVERHLFIPKEIQKYAYRNSALPIGYQQTISQPYIVAYMTNALQLNTSYKVLEIGTGSGYQTAILGEICKEVYSIEIVEPLGLHAKMLLKKLNYKNITIRIGDGYKGWPTKAPFDAIIVTCAPTKIPQALINQLVEGGRIAIPYGNKYSQRLKVFVKKNGKLEMEDMISVRFVPMVNPQGKKY